jgi:hypothetical protein
MSSQQLMITQDPNLGKPIGNAENRRGDWNTYGFWIGGQHVAHCRCLGGNLSSPNYFQFAFLNMRAGAPDSHNIGDRLDEFGGSSWPAPTGWRNYSPLNGEYTYWLGGSYHKDGHWRLDTGLDVTKQRHDFGVKWTVGFANGDNRYDDYKFEVAVTWGDQIRQATEGALKPLIDTSLTSRQ